MDMNIKYCASCKESKLITEFNRRRGTQDGLAYSCKQCQNKSNKNWCKNNWSNKIKQQKERRQSLRTRLVEYKKERGCQLCKEIDESCLEFHHLNHKQKEIDPANMVGAGWSWSRMETELEKCIVLCANCHRKLHAGKLFL